MRLKAIVALALGMLVAAGASAQTMRQGEKLDNATKQTGTRVGGMSASDSIAWLLPFDTSGNLKVTQSAPIQEQYLDGTTAIIDKSIQTASAESSTVINTHGYRLAGLMIKAVVKDSVAVGYVTLAIQVRAHFNTSQDSSSTFPWSHAWDQATNPNMGTWSIDSLTFSQVLPTVSTASANQEMVVRLISTQGRNGGTFGVGPVAYIPLNGRLSQYWAPYTSVRVRVLACNRNNVTPVTVRIVGTPL